MAKVTFFSSPWGEPHVSVALNNGVYFGIRENGWGGFSAEKFNIGKNEQKPSVHIRGRNEWREAVLKAISMSQSASELGRKGGASKSDAKAQASRANGRKGGRPRKPADR